MKFQFNRWEGKLEMNPPLQRNQQDLIDCDASNTKIVIIFLLVRCRGEIT